MIGRSFFLPPLGLLLALSGSTRADGPTAGGRLAWVLDGDLDLVGDLWADVPFALGPSDSLYLSVETRTDMRRPEERFTFRVEDLQYDIDFGWRARRPFSGGRPVFVFAGQRGREQVDVPGRAYVRYLGLGIESRRFGDPAPGSLDWRIAAGPVLDEHGVDATFVARGSAHLWLAAAGRSTLGLDLRYDGLVEEGLVRSDVAFGPRLSIPAVPGALASLFLAYQHSDHPLGRRETLWLLGFAYEQASGGPPDSPVAIEGLLGAGGGAGRGAGQLRLGFHSPAFARSYRAVVVADANVLASEHDGDLYYLYHLGIERPGRRWTAGAYFSHRSNHVLARAGSGITSVNVVEVGLEDPGWDLPGRRDAGPGWKLELGARTGYLLDSAFGEDRRWQTRGGLRLTPAGFEGAWQPYVVVEAEAGEVERRKYAVGIAPREDLELQLEYRSDEQYFSRDPRLWLLFARYALGSRPRVPAFR